MDIDPVLLPLVTETRAGGRHGKGGRRGKHYRCGYGMRSYDRRTSGSRCAFSTLDVIGHSGSRTESKLFLVLNGRDRLLIVRPGHGDA